MVLFMLHVSDYDFYIFDCDGVILDSNQLKIDAMKNALCQRVNNSVEVENCIEYFRSNFGKSRFHHIEVFLAKYVTHRENETLSYRNEILKSYSTQCKKLYLKAELTPGFLDFISSLKGNKYVASGSEQQELRDVFSQRSLDKFFVKIYGSPVSKSENVKKIVNEEFSNDAVMFGDAVSDLNASIDNEIDFIAYTAYSNVVATLTLECKRNNSLIINDWSTLNKMDRKNV